MIYSYTSDLKWFFKNKVLNKKIEMQKYPAFVIYDKNTLSTSL